jgi:hypothetical protein
MKEWLMIAMKSDQSRLVPSAPEERLNIAATPHYMQYEDVLAFNAVNNHIFAAGKTSQPRTKVLVPASSQIGVVARRKKRSIIESIRRSAISMLPLSLAM